MNEVQDEEEREDIHEDVEDGKEEKEEEEMEDNIPGKEFFCQKSPVNILANGKEPGDVMDDLKNPEEVLTNFFDKPRLKKQEQQKIWKNCFKKYIYILWPSLPLTKITHTGDHSTSLSVLKRALILSNLDGVGAVDKRHSTE